MVEVQYEGFEGVENWGSSMVVCNHPTILDAVLVMSRVPGIDCVMSAKLLANPITAGAVQLCGFISNHSLLQMIRACRECLTAGGSVLMFPEGTRTVTPPTGPFSHAYALAGVAAGSVIRTLLIRCDSDYFGRGFSFFRPARCPIRYRITVGRSFEVCAGEDAREVSGRIEGYFRDELTREGQP